MGEGCIVSWKDWSAAQGAPCTKTFLCLCDQYIIMENNNPTERTRVSAEIPQELLKRLRKYVVDSRNSLHAQSAVICELLEQGLKEKGY
jgi:hypothetical protein